MSQLTVSVPLIKPLIMPVQSWKWFLKWQASQADMDPNVLSVDMVPSDDPFHEYWAHLVTERQHKYKRTLRRLAKQNASKNQPDLFDVTSCILGLTKCNTSATLNQEDKPNA